MISMTYLAYVMSGVVCGVAIRDRSGLLLIVGMTGVQLAFAIPLMRFP